MPTANQPVIIVKRVKKGHAAHHGGAWKVAYADFVTAMMALFMVLWLVSSSEQVKKAIGGYFNDPTGKGKEVGNGMRGAGGESLSLQKDDMSKLKEKLEQAIKTSQPFQQMKEHVVMTVTGEGLRIELLEDAKGMFFESGNSEPTPFGKDLMARLAAEIGKLPNHVTVEGHTDAKPYTGRGDYSNWELSTDRANAARRWMQANGMRDDQVTQVRGFGDQSPRKPEDPEDDSNRRVSFIVQYQPTESNPGLAQTSGAVGASGGRAPTGRTAGVRGGVSSSGTNGATHDSTASPAAGAAKSGASQQAAPVAGIQANKPSPVGGAKKK